jgi:hypothetical protein
LSWPEEGLALANAMLARPGRIVLSIGAQGSEDTLAALAEVLGAHIFRVGSELIHDPAASTTGSLETRLLGHPILADIDVLFWRPMYDVDILRLLADLARRGPIVAAWPGEINGSRATYSRVGRRDFFEGRVSNAMVLRPRSRRFPDQAPFEIEYVPT